MAEKPEFDARAIIARMRDDYWTGVAASPDPAVVEKVACVTFELGPACYALPVERVREVLRVPWISKLPRSPEALLGVVNVRGQVLPVLDLRALLGHPSRPPDRHARLLVARSGEVEAGLVVERVRSIAEIPRRDLREPPTLSGSLPRELIAGQASHEGSLVALLNLDAVLERCRATLRGGG